MVEYPIGIAAVWLFAAAVTAGLYSLAELIGAVDHIPTVEDGQAVMFYTVTALILAGCAMATVYWTARMPGIQRGELLGLAMAMAVLTYVNWDLLAVAAVAAALWTWHSGHPALTGALIGVGAATKLYPALLLVAVVLVCAHSRHWRAAAAATVSAVASWCVLNLPVLAMEEDFRRGWLVFYEFSRSRGVDRGTTWYLIELLLGHPEGQWTSGNTARLNLAIAIAFAAAVIVIAMLALTAPRPPEPAVLAFLLIAVFLLTGKAWSPQFALWLMPLLVLTHPPRWAAITWVTAELTHYAAVLWYINGLRHGTGPTLTADLYLPFLTLRWASLALLCALLIHRLIRPAAPADTLPVQPAAPRRKRIAELHPGRAIPDETVDPQTLHQ